MRASRKLISMNAPNVRVKKFRRASRGGDKFRQVLCNVLYMSSREHRDSLRIHVPGTMRINPTPQSGPRPGYKGGIQVYRVFFEYIMIYTYR